MADEFFYEEINRAGLDIPHMEALHNLQYCSHYHEEVELMLVVDGMIILTVDGQSFELEAGDIAFVGPFQIHSLNTPVHSRLHLFKILSPQYDFSTIHRDQSILHPGEEENAVIRVDILRLMAELSLPQDDPLKRLAVRAATDRLLVDLIRLPGVHPIEKSVKLANDRDVELLKTINTYLEDHFREAVTLEEAATACHMSMYYFAHSFKQATGTTFLSYLNGFRLEKARRLILETEESFTTIAMKCGFASIRTFNRCFRQHFKITPTEAKSQWKPSAHSIKLK